MQIYYRAARLTPALFKFGQLVNFFQCEAFFVFVAGNATSSQTAVGLQSSIQNRLFVFKQFFGKTILHEIFKHRRNQTITRQLFESIDRDVKFIPGHVGKEEKKC